MLGFGVNQQMLTKVYSHPIEREIVFGDPMYIYTVVTIVNDANVYWKVTI